MKSKKTILAILLNIVFCAVLLWFFTRNAFLRPFSGSFIKEFISGIVLLGSLYINYFLLYPKIYQKHRYVYWIAVVLIAITTGLVDFGLAKKNILFCAAGAIQIVGTFNFFLKIYFLIVFRNLSFNLFPFLFRERQHFKKSLDKEVRIVYQEVRKLDVVDEHNNVRLVPIEDIFYCHQQRNFTDICTVQNIKYTRLGSMKHLEQLFGEEEFIRITSTVLVPFRYIRSCKGNTVVMQKRAWEEASTTFQLEPKTQEQVAEKIAAALQKYRETASDDTVPQKPKRPKISRKPATPPQEKVLEVLSCIKEHPNCNTADIVAATGFSLSTVERSISELKKQGLIQYRGSKKSGGYYAVGG